MTLAGIVLGVLVAFGGTRLMVSLLYEVEPTDLQTFVTVALTMGGHGRVCVDCAGAAGGSCRSPRGAAQRVSRR